MIWNKLCKSFECLYDRLMGFHLLGNEAELREIVVSRVKQLSMKDVDFLIKLPAWSDEKIIVNQVEFGLVTRNDLHKEGRRISVTCWAGSTTSVIVYADGFVISPTKEIRMMDDDEVASLCNE